jgi:hypothetical protein
MVLPGLRFASAMKPPPLSATVATTGVAPSNSMRIAATRREDKHSIFPISSTR